MPKSDRRSDHEAIARLADDLLPALIAKLSTTQLGELEVREGEWHVRLRRPYGIGPGEGRRSGDKPSRTQPGHEGHGHGRAGVEGRQRASTGSPTGTTAGSGAASAASNGSNGTGRQSSRDGDGDRSRSIAQSPGVGYFQPGPKAASGTRVRAGDALGTVDVLGVRQDVTAPADGIVGQTLVEAGTAVEYGQELIRLEMTGPATAGAGSEAR
ncbi:MAG TPA: acetyl-CoA carboxylase biotin carboxyl carrier protein subunit [Candidatus Limnocylindrales bacterium]|nr:acetyl-CoA carboxylase biotin carboxyl carrier protein subunit [Candidatus Limnocylindrales bacterium]